MVRLGHILNEASIGLRESHEPLLSNRAGPLQTRDRKVQAPEKKKERVCAQSENARMPSEA